MELRTYRKHIILSILLLVKLLAISTSSSSRHEIPIGVILNMQSLSGQMVHSSISMAISDFYSLNDDYNTRLILHIKDSNGEPLRALSLALDLVENLKVQAIVGSETPLEAKFLGILTDKTKVPFISLSTNPSISSAKYRYLLQMTQDETIQWKGVVAIAESFKWNNVVFVYEDIESIPYVINSFRTKEIHICYMSFISPSTGDDELLEELQKLLDLQAKVFIIHVSPSLAFRILVRAKRLGLMAQGYVWIITDKTMNLFDPVECDEETLESFQGVLGLRYHIQSSSQFRNFSRRWRKEYPFNNLSFGNILAYDAIWAIAMAVERAKNELSNCGDNFDGMKAVNLTNIQVSENGRFVLEELLKVSFKGLSGEFLRIAKRTQVVMPLEIVNVVGNSERRVGFYTELDGITMYLKSKPRHQNLYSFNGLETIIWPGGSITPPRHRKLQKSSVPKLRIGVPMLVGFEEFLNVEQDRKTNTITAKGFCIDVFKAAIEGLPYKVHYEFVPLGGANERPNSRTYDQLIYEVYLQKYDGFVGDATITANRSLYVDFTIPYTDLGVGTVAKVDNERNIWWFLEPLDARMWVATACSFFVIGAMIWLIENPINREFQGPWLQVAGNVILFSFSTLTFSHRAKLKSIWSKLLVIVWLCILLIMLSCYNAALSSMLTVQQIQLTRRGIYIGYQAGSFMEGVIVNNSDFKHPSLRPYNSLNEYASALSNGSKKGGVVAIMDEFPYIKLFLAKYGNAYTLVSYEPNTNGFGFIFQKGSPLVPDISREIAKLREEGELLKLEKKWFKKGSSFLPDDSQAVDVTILTLHNFRGLFMFGGVFLALVLVGLLICYMYSRSYLIYYVLVHPSILLELLHLT